MFIAIKAFNPMAKCSKAGGPKQAASLEAAG